MRTLVLGDIHGNYKALVEVLDLANYNPVEDRLICVGDYVDGYPESYKVIETLIHYNELSNNKNIYILGNHDDWFKDSLSTDMKAYLKGDLDYISNSNFSWWNQGGKSTCKSYIGQIDPKPDYDKHLQFLRSLKYYHIENNICFVHAGWDYCIYDSIESAYKFEPADLIWNRNLNSRAIHLQYLLNKGHSITDVKAKFGGFDKIFIGHSSWDEDYLTHFPTLQICNIYNLDGGAGHKGRLIAYELETGKIYKSELAGYYYPDHNPRG